MKVYIVLSDEAESRIKNVCQTEFTAMKYQVYYESAFPNTSFCIEVFDVEAPGME